MSGEADAAVTSGTLLDGRVRYDQFRGGYRTGIEPVLLAAAVPARAGGRVIEAGSGAGAALLCLAWRVPGVTGLGVERDPALAALATANAAANGWAGRVAFRAACIEDMESGGVPGFDHAMANPPWHDPGGPRSPDAGRDLAKRAAGGLLEAWSKALARAVRPGGTVSLILPASQFADGAEALHACGCGSLRLLPLWPRAGEAARLVIVQAVKAGRGAAQLLPGMCLHDTDGRFSDAAERVLRAGGAIEMAKAGPGAEALAPPS